MSYASRKPQSRAEADANARALRSMVKQPDNKVCADCKRNDTRWASWNIGCFLCIRCSGIHRSMGTHISRVKSIDLDMWTMEQMDSMRNWGNKLVNVYWEAHLKPGHVPPDHKIESFIRSKYEARRWAIQGPPPQDPSALLGSAGAGTLDAEAAAAPKSVAPTKSDALLDLLGDAAPAPTPAASRAPPAVSNTSALAPKPAANAPPTRAGGLFDLDWDDSAGSAAHATQTQTSVRSTLGSKGKQDILSLFSAPRPAATPSAFSQEAAPMGHFGAPALESASPHMDITGTQDIWGAPKPAGATPASNDAFADIWGDFT
ncbi:ARF GAP with effector function(s) [Malassezia vespertilionis]|uniref:Arf-GAP domain-containing protein n=1 Tax=Malassezia vespertilionis TaxID=2020962 RepID=A0A2N1J6Y2_9BASI|nr:ARF GAP with effector function(s) [Malassezia vespertilionis]PKI82310.1 hypothetical protein MVES_003789 [Malassezia vespertilionis]WFD07934.1 ARF GAP with effector function(s) [Malassezia vespertilionis]